MQPRYGCWASDYRRNLTRILVYLSWAMIMILDWWANVHAAQNACVCNSFHVQNCPGQMPISLQAAAEQCDFDNAFEVQGPDADIVQYCT